MSVQADTAPRMRDDLLYQEAMEWIRAREAAGFGPITLAEFSRVFAARLHRRPLPVGSTARLDATQLFSRLDHLAARFSTVQERERWLLLAAEIGSVPQALEPTVVRLALRHDPTSPRYQRYLFQYLASPKAQPDLVQLIRRALLPQLQCRPESAPSLALPVVRLGLLAVDRPRDWPQGARQLAMALCAMDRGTEAVPYLSASREAGIWPPEYALLQAYCTFAKDEYEQTADLAAARVSQSGLGSAGDGALLRVGLALGRVGQAKEAARFLTRVETRFGWIATHSAWLVSSASEDETPAGGPPESEYPEAWLETYWQAAYRCRETDAPAAWEAMGQLLTAAVTPTARRWAEELLNWALRQALAEEHWDRAARLAVSGSQAGLELLPGWQQLLLQALSGAPTSSPDTLAPWLMETLAAGDPERMLHAALLAMLCKSPLAPELAYAALRSASTTGPLRNAAEGICRCLVQRGTWADCASWQGGGGDLVGWNQVIRQAVAAKLAQLVVYTPAAALPEALAEAPTLSDPSLAMLAAALTGNLEALPGMFRRKPPPGDVRAAAICFLCGVLLRAGVTSTDPGSVGLEIQDALVGVVPKGTTFPAGFRSLVQAADQGREKFLEAWQRELAPKRRIKRRPLLAFLTGFDDALPDDGEVIRLVLAAAPVPWPPAAPAFPIPFTEADLRHWLQQGGRRADGRQTGI